MITPTSITNFNRTDKELQLFWIFGIIVAGRNSDWAAQKVFGLFKGLSDDETPFQWIKANATSLHNTLVANRVGQYTRTERALLQSCELDLRTATIDDLLGVFGVGPKTARFFLLHSRPYCDVAVLDVHILRWMREECGVEDAPQQTPTNLDKYRYFERLCVSLMRAKFPGVTMADIDLMLWSKMSGRE